MAAVTEELWISGCLWGAVNMIVKYKIKRETSYFSEVYFRFSFFFFSRQTVTLLWETGAHPIALWCESLQSPSQWPLLPVWVHLAKCDRLSCQKRRRFFASLLFLQTERASTKKKYKDRPPREVLFFFSALCLSVHLWSCNFLACQLQTHAYPSQSWHSPVCVWIYIYICMHRCTADWKDKMTSPPSLSLSCCSPDCRYLKSL